MKKHSIVLLAIVSQFISLVGRADDSAQDPLASEVLELSQMLNNTRDLGSTTLYVSNRLDEYMGFPTPDHLQLNTTQLNYHFKNLPPDGEDVHHYFQRACHDLEDAMFHALTDQSSTDTGCVQVGKTGEKDVDIVIESMDDAATASEEDCMKQTAFDNCGLGSVTPMVDGDYRDQILQAIQNGNTHPVSVMKCRAAYKVLDQLDTNIYQSAQRAGPPPQPKLTLQQKVDKAEASFDVWLNKQPLWWAHWYHGPDQGTGQQ